jgi:hypothetical protein
MKGPFYLGSSFPEASIRGLCNNNISPASSALALVSYLSKLLYHYGKLLNSLLLSCALVLTDLSIQLCCNCK